MGARRILVVDDEQYVTRTLAGILAREGFETHQAGDGETALRLMGQHVFGVVTADIRMPGMNGIQLLEKISTQYPDTRRLVITGLSDFGQRLATQRDTGLVHGELAKPCSRRGLLALVTAQSAIYSMCTATD